MRYSDQSYNLRIELDTKNCDCSPELIEEMETALSPLRKPVEEFPVSDLYITVYYHPRVGTYEVKTALTLPKRTLATREEHDQVYTAFERCVRKLGRKLEKYKSELAGEEQQQKLREGTEQVVLPEQLPDVAELKQAVEAGDYKRFRLATFPYEESVRKRLGRWIQRYPKAEAALGSEWTLADLVEEVFLNAFERFEERPQAVPFSEWLEALLDPSVKAFQEHPREARESVDFARTLQETDLEAEYRPFRNSARETRPRE